MIRFTGILLLFLFAPSISHACSILYYTDKSTGKIYAVNNEDYWYDVKPYIKIEKRKEGELARLWYGWNDFAQGGINEAGLFFDGASTPIATGDTSVTISRENEGNQILSKCKTIQDVVNYFGQHKISHNNAHLLFGDKNGDAVIIEWTNGRMQIVPALNGRLLMTNFCITDQDRGNYPCPRYNAMESELDRIEKLRIPIDLKLIGNVAAKAVQPPYTNNKGRTSGTLYSTFINITDMEFVVIYKLDNTKMTKLDLNYEFGRGRSRKIRM